MLKNAYTSKKYNGLCYSALAAESTDQSWIPAFAGMTPRLKAPFQRSRCLKVVLSYAFLLSLLVLPTIPLYADVCTGWRDFGLTAQEDFYSDTFAVEDLKFSRTGDVQAELKIRNFGREEARAAISIALFDSKRSLLTTASFSPPLLQPNDADKVSVEFLGSAEVLPEIKYYQLSIIERGER